MADTANTGHPVLADKDRPPRTLEKSESLLRRHISTFFSSRGAVIAPPTGVR